MTFSRKAVEQSLQRIFSGGRLDLLPRRQGDREMLLALGAWRLHDAGVTDEQATNLLLESWLRAFCFATLDRVTFRRALVDEGFISRRRDGTRYWINTQKIHLVLSPDALDVDPAAVFERETHEREARKHRYLAANGQDTACD